MAKGIVHLSKPLVYIIDDDHEVLKALEWRFNKSNCEAVTFDAPGKFFESLKKRVPNLILCDLNLGEDISGFDVIKKIRATHDTPIIILSGDTDPKNVAHGLEIGANDYIVKQPLRNIFESILSEYLFPTTKDLKNEEPFRQVIPGKGEAKLQFSVEIEEVHPSGFVLLTDHLVKKNASFSLKGESLRNILSDCESLFVTVIATESRLVGEEKKYLLYVEVDSAQEQYLKEIRNFISSKVTELIKPNS